MGWRQENQKIKALSYIEIKASVAYRMACEGDRKRKKTNLEWCKNPDISISSHFQNRSENRDRLWFSRAVRGKRGLLSLW